MLARVCVRGAERLQGLVQRAVAAELKAWPLIVGATGLTADFVAREEIQQLRAVLASDGVATVCALQGMRGV